MLIGAVAALLAALCWTLSSGIWRRVPTSLSALQLNLLKNLIGSLTLLPVLLWPGAWQGVSAPSLLALMLSGALGIALGDSFYFAALRRLGTRRSLTLDAGGPALSALLAQLTLAESLQPQQWLAVALISLAVLIVARQARRVVLPRGNRGWDCCVSPWRCSAAWRGPCSRVGPWLAAAGSRSRQRRCACWRRWR